MYFPQGDGGMRMYTLIVSMSTPLHPPATCLLWFSWWRGCWQKRLVALL